MNDPYLMNRLANAKNPYQGEGKKVLCVCSAGLLRSPTAAWVLAQEPYNYNTRACGITPQFALIPFDRVLATWADEIVCMTEEQADEVETRIKEWVIARDIVVLDIPDNFSYREPRLIQLIDSNYGKTLK